jgi:hypothetical protein
LRVGLTNLPFVLALTIIGQLHPFVQTLVVGAAMFLAPGLAWSDRGKGDAFVVLFRAVLASLIAALMVWLALMPLPGPTDRTSFILALGGIANLGLFFGFRRGWYRANPFAATPARLILVVAALFYVQSFLGAAYFVPALEDQDMETQGTAYGLMHEATPTMTTNRPTDVGGRYFFAHPLLLHFWIGESALLTDDLDAVRYHHDSSLAARDDPAHTLDYWRGALAQFEREPMLLPTRTPNLFLGAFFLFPLGLLVFRLTGSHTAALGSCVLYITLPEIYVRSSYGGYLAVTNFLLMSGAYFYAQACGLFPDQKEDAGSERGLGRRLAAGAMFLGGWADQKAILLPLAAAAHALLRAALDKPFMKEALGSLRAWRPISFLRQCFARADILAGFIVGAAFLAGWGSYALYGLSIAPQAFIQDHIQGHFAERMNLGAVNVFGSEYWYPSVAGLWLEFMDHSGWLLAPAALLAALYAVTQLRQAHGLFLLWAAIGALAFSVVDWRQTKHMAHFLPALAVLVAVYWASLQGRAKWALSALIGAAILWNMWRVGLQMQNFEYIQPTPIW